MNNPLKLCPKTGYHQHEELCDQCVSVRLRARSVIAETLGGLESKALDSPRDRMAVFQALCKALDL